MKRTVKDLVNLEGKVVILRVDFNVPLDDGGKILDTTRIVQSLPTIKYLIGQKAKVVLISHLGRPEGYEIRKSLWPIALILIQALPTSVHFINKVYGDEVKQRINDMGNGEVLLLENVRFYKEEIECDMAFARKIASLGDYFVNDAFGVAHRKHATTYGLARLMPNAIGLLMEKEVSALTGAVDNPKHPFVFIIGGGKVQGKINLILKLLDSADTVIIGGAMAYTFLVASGVAVGESKVYDESVSYARDILNIAKERGKKILLPIDHVCIRESAKRKKPFVTDEMVDDMVGFDIGPKTIALFKEEIKNAKQILWNGPLGKYEDPEFAKGTMEIAKAIADSDAYSIVGGGDSLSAIKMAKVENKIDLISTGGGATLKFIEQGSLPCIDVIQDKIVLKR